MGFDIYGMNPKINKDYPPRFDEIMKKYGAGKIVTGKPIFFSYIKVNIQIVNTSII